MSKILIIGQAPPAVKQNLPYDTTMLYDWLLEVGITKEKAQELFIFDAVSDEFPGFNKNGGHKKPSWTMFIEYWTCELKQRVEESKSIIVLGNVAKEYLSLMDIKKPMIFLIHPSKRNISLYDKNKDEILNKLKSII